MFNATGGPIRITLTHFSINNLHDKGPGLEDED